MSFKTRLTTKILCAVIVISTGFSPRAQADDVRDFVTSCAYGALAGTLVGAATLAFSNRPGENLNNVARGASLGLYTGILLGAWVVFGGPSASDDLPPGYVIEDSGELRLVALAAPARTTYEPIKFSLAPTFSDRGVDGVSAQFQAFSF